MPSSTFPVVEYRVQLEPGVILWKVGANTADFIPDHIILAIGNDPLAMGMLQAGIPVFIVEDIRGCN